MSSVAQEPREAYDCVEIPKIEPDVTRVTLHGGVRPCCARRFKAPPPEGLERGSPFGPNLLGNEGQARKMGVATIWPGQPRTLDLSAGRQAFHDNVSAESVYLPHASAAAQLWALGYDNLGNLTSVTDPVLSGQAVGNKHQYHYDGLNRLDKATDPALNFVMYAHDPSDILDQLTDARALVTSREIDGFGEVIQETSPDRGGLTYWYDASGNLVTQKDTSGVQTLFTYDQDYRLSGITVAPPAGASTLGLGFTWQPDGRLSTVTDPAGTGRAASFGYTPSGRVTTGAGPWGTFTYLYDAAGNRTQSGPASAPVIASVATTSNQITQTTVGGVSQRVLTYRPSGELARDAHAGGIGYNYTYTIAKRLITVQQNGLTAGSYAYDFKGARVWRQTYGTGAAQTAYIYDEAGHLLAEHNAVTGAVNREYVWIDDLPVALITVSGGVETTDYIHTGQIDEPLAMTSATQALVWNAYVDPFGVATTFTPPSTTLDMRLPGQSLQLETNSLHQNHWRDYDPSLGRYIEPDPLGIDAGQNVYGYVDGDPINLDDFRGLAPWHWNGMGNTDICKYYDCRIKQTNGRLCSYYKFA
jgi:RHS repeat-associated protein